MKSHRFLIRLAVAVLAVLLVGTALWAKERAEIDDQFKWNVTDLFASIDVFKQEKDAIVVKAEKLATYRGKLGESAPTLKEALDTYYDLERDMRRLEAYTSRLADQDARVAEFKGYKSQIETVRTKLNEAASFIDPETLAMDRARLESFLTDGPTLAQYVFPIRETLRKQRHILSDKEERILAAAGDIADAGYNTYNLFTNADLPYPTVSLMNDERVKMTYANFDTVRRSLVPENRRIAFQAVFGLYDSYKRTIAEMLYSQLKTYRFYATMRGYNSTLEMALDDDAIPTAIYHSLVEAAHQNLPTFHRYLKLKARALGQTELDYTDMYVPFAQEVEFPVPYGEAQDLLLSALAPLGEKYVATLRDAFANGWIDVYPNEGKDSGAYASGWAYDVHPYVLMNYTDNYYSALTLAHEMGHALHSFNSNAAQPFAISYYSTFTAEVASTLNENLVNDMLLRQYADNDDVRLFLLGNFLDGTLKGTFFRQIHFAEFELMMHRRVAAGESLTGEALSEMFLKLTRQYYGHDQGIVRVPELIGAEWSVVPHFYYNFYVYQYATSIAAASLIAQRIIDGEPGALDAYFANLLTAGGSDHPVDLLTRAGADMTEPEAYRALIERANRYMDEVEIILDKKGL